LPPRTIRRPARRVWLVAAIATAFVLAIIGGAIVIRLRTDDPLRELAKDVDHRHIEARISGFPYHEYEPPMRGGTAGALKPEEWKVARAASDIFARAQQKPTPENLHALGVSHLVIGTYDDAVAQFELALTTETHEPNAARAIAKSNDAALLSDAAAAYLARAKAHRLPADPLALEAAQRAWTLEQRPEIAWNRALAIEQMHVPTDAIAAWDDYLRLDPKSRWAAEARERLKKLRAPTDAEEWQRVAPRIGALAEDPRVLDDVVRRFAQQARITVEETLLPEWGSAELAGDSARAGERLETARAVAASLHRVTGLAFDEAAVRAIDTSRGDARLTLARGHAAYGAARKLFDGHDFKPADEGFRAALSAMDGTPFAAAPRVYRIAGLFMADDYNAAIAAADELERKTPHAGHPLLAQLNWLRALSELDLGRPDAAIEHYRVAAEHFRAAREDDNVATIESLIADALDSVGDEASAMPLRMKALETVARTGGSHRNIIMAEAAYAAMSAGHPATAHLFLSPLINHRSGIGGSNWRCTALLWSSSLRSEAGDREGALQEIQRAKASCGAISDPRVRQRTLANMTLVDTAAPADHVEAVKWIDEALGFFRSTDNRLCVAGLLARRGRAHAASRDVKKAERDFRESVDVIEGAGDGISDGEQRDAFLAASGRVYADLVDLLLSEQRYVEAFEIVERSRSADVAHSHHGTRKSRPHSDWMRSQLPPGCAIVEYALRDDALITWVVTPGGISAIRTKVRRSELLALAGRASANREHADLTKLHALLIAPWAKSVPAGSTIVFVPDPAIEPVPLAALVDAQTGRYVAEDFSTGVAPSALSFMSSAMMYRERGGDRALLVADPSLDAASDAALPPLDAARGAVSSIAKLYPQATTLVGDDATKQSFLRLAAEANVIDFAGHAQANEAAPRYSSLVFRAANGDDGRLYVGELPPSSLANARLAVLSACSTARGSREQRGTVTLARAFLKAGVPSVVGTLWPVHDDAGEFFSREFHRSVQQGRMPAAALRDAQLAMLHSPKAHLRDPSSWGAFRLLGAAVTLKEDHQCLNCVSSSQVSAR